MTPQEIARDLRDPVMSQSPRLHTLAAESLESHGGHLAEQLAQERKTALGLLATIRRLDAEKARWSLANQRLTQEVMELRALVNSAQAATNLIAIQK